MFCSDNIKNITAFFLVFGCVVGKGLFLGIAVLLLLIYIIKKGGLIKNDFGKLKSTKTSVKFMVIFILGLLISGIFSPNSYGVKEAIHYLERMAPFFIILFPIINNINAEKYIALGLLAGSCIICADALYGYFFLGVSRPYGILGSSNILGGTLILIVPFLFLYLYKLRSNKKIFYFSIITILVVLLTLFLIKSRGAWLGLIAAVMSIPIVLYKIRKISLKKTAMIFVTFILLFIGIYMNYNDRFHRGYDYERPALRNIAIHIFLDNPLVGIGMGNFTSKYVSDSYISPLAYQKHYLSHAHNIYLKFLSETGLIGISVFFILIGFQLKVIWENVISFRNKSLYAMAMFFAIIGMLVHGWVDVCFSARYYAMLYWCLWGIVYYNLAEKYIEDSN